MPQRGANIKTQLKYREAVSLYVMSCLSLKKICEKTNVGFVGFCNYLSKYHRDLILIRHNLSGQENARLRGKKGQTTTETLESITKHLGLTYKSVGGFIRRNHPEAIQQYKALVASLDEGGNNGQLKARER